MVVGVGAPISDKKCLKGATPPFPFGGCGNRIAAAYLHPANNEERQLHRRTQTREIGSRKVTKRDGLGIVVIHDAVSFFVFDLSQRDPPGSRAKKKKTPVNNRGLKVTTMNSCYKNCSE